METDVLRRSDHSLRIVAEMSKTIIAASAQRVSNTLPTSFFAGAALVVMIHRAVVDGDRVSTDGTQAALRFDLCGHLLRRKPELALAVLATCVQRGARLATRVEPVMRPGVCIVLRKRLTDFALSADLGRD
jgi:hypothetical protein